MEMYSLYRAWLQFGTTTGGGYHHQLQPATFLNLPPAVTAVNQSPGAPDVSLQVGPGMTHFSAHKAVLSAHSGYFKAALMNHTDMEPISVPNVNVDEFSYLLTFMYTGYLDLNIRNIYNILLATHILHMPTALEICRSFLLHSQNVENRTGTGVIKPIASRKALAPTQPIYAPSSVNVLPKSEDTPFKLVRQPTDVKPIAALSYNDRATTSRSVPEPEKPFGPDKPIKSKKRAEHHHPQQQQQQHQKVIIDVACCDGPVRFHRVINKNYGSENRFIEDQVRETSTSDENRTVDMFTCLYCNHTFKSQYCYQKHARRHLNPVDVEAKTAPKEQAKREVKLLDMNVQYYPCKTCGSKFPSYYFVHKHRKLCHAEEMADVNNRNNEIVMEEERAGASVDHASTTSSIDVEGDVNETTS